MGPKKTIFPLFFQLFVSLFSIYLAPSGAKYCEKGWAAPKNWRGVIGKPILGLLTFGLNPFGYFETLEMQVFGA